MKNRSFLQLVAGFVVLAVFITGCNNTNEEDAEITPVQLEIKENTAVPTGGKLSGSISINSTNIQKIDLLVDDSVYQSWNTPKERLSFNLDVAHMGLGAKTLRIEALLSNGDTHNDNRLVRIVSDLIPEKRTTKITAVFPHNEEDFTQGLEFSEGKLYESTGDPRGIGASIVALKDLKSGSTLLKTGLDASYFGEGITILNDKIYQLTWTQQKCFVYDKNNLQIRLKDYNYTGEGWGLCNDGKNLIMSDGSERIVFRNPDNFQIIRTIEVYDNKGPRPYLNELEYINGKIYANVWMTDLIVAIDPATGKVLEEINASNVSAVGKKQGDVMNGIAYNHLTGKTYITGKYWTNLYEVVFE